MIMTELLPRTLVKYSLPGNRLRRKDIASLGTERKVWRRGYLRRQAHEGDRRLHRQRREGGDGPRGAPEKAAGAERQGRPHPPSGRQGQEAEAAQAGDHQNEEEAQHGQGGHDAQADGLCSGRPGAGGGECRRAHADAEDEGEAQEEPRSVAAGRPGGRRLGPPAAGAETEGGGQGGQGGGGGDAGCSHWRRYLGSTLIPN